MKKFNIGIFHYIANLTDGVSLEMNKWKEVFQEMGHTVHLCAGKFGSAEEYVVEEMYHHRPEVRLLNQNTFKTLQDYPNEEVYRSELYHLAEVIEEKIRTFIEEKGINLLVPNNVWSVAANPAVAIALTNIMWEYHVPAIAHNHDFYFERMDGYALTCGTAAELADCYLPPRSPLAKHVVINSLAQRELLRRKGIQSTVIPNIFDFGGLSWAVDDYNQDLRERIGLNENDVFVLQATRIVTRKGIEVAIDFVHALNAPERREVLKSQGLYDGRKFFDDSRIVLVLAGYAMDDVTGRYQNLLANKAEQVGIEAIFIADLVDERRKIKNGKKIYSLWDTYSSADFVTYPSLWEGWGNQLLEALKAKLPVMLFEYPVYKADIKDKGLRVISIGDQVGGYDDYGLATVVPEIIENAADEAVQLLTNMELREATVEHNFKIGKKYYSLDALYIYLDQLLHSLDE